MKNNAPADIIPHFQRERNHRNGGFMKNIDISSVRAAAPRMRTITETAKETGFPVHAIRQLVKHDKIVYVMCGTKALVNLDRFIEYLNSGENGVNV